jgi:signal transduction histidine kinase
MIAVTDTGIGIEASDQLRLFKAFSRILSHLSAKIPGTGLGLYLTRKIAVEILHGNISVDSKPGSGSTFSIIIPCLVAEEQTPEQALADNEVG